MAKPQPDRPHYAFPPSGSRLSAISAAVAGLVLLLGVGLYVAGWKSEASPGALASKHAPLDGACEQCHGPHRGDADARCERCHDPGGSRRLGTAAHATAAAMDASVAARLPPMACAACHTEHGGRTAALSTAVDRTCTTCHDIRSFAAHPEFAVVRAGGTNAVGLRFSHARHLDVLKQQQSAARCEGCHEPAPDGQHFKPLDFDRHCASCHLGNGALTNGNTALTVIVTSGDPLPGPPTIAHRDPRILDAITGLQPAFDADGLGQRMERRRLADALDRLVAAAPVTPAGLDRAALDAWATSLSGDLAAIDRRLQETPARPTTPEDSGARRDQLRALLEAVRSSGDAPAQARALELQQQLQAGGAAPDPQEDGAALDRLAMLDEVVDRIKPSIGRRAAAALRDDIARARDSLLAGSMTADALAARRAELAALLDLVAARAAATDAARIAALRASVAELAFTGAGRAGLLRLRAAAAALLARVRLQAELASSGHGPSDAVVRQQVANWSREVAALRDRLAAPRGPAAAAPVLSPRAAAARIRSVAAGCEFCHVLTRDGDGLAPVARDLALFAAASFTHKPHVAEADACESCHTGVAASGDRGSGPQDALVPGVASCQTCHVPGRSPSTCVSCHAYHAPVSRRAGVAP